MYTDCSSRDAQQPLKSEAGNSQPETTSLDTTSAPWDAERLTPEERETLAKQIETICTENQSFWRQGRAFRTVKDQRLYREEFKNDQGGPNQSFGEFCEKYGKCSRAQAYRLIDAAGVMDDLHSLSQNRDNFPEESFYLPTRLAYALPLAPVKEPKKRLEVWLRVLKDLNGKPPYEKLIKAVVAELRTKPAKQGTSRGNKSGNKNSENVADSNAASTTSTPERVVHPETDNSPCDPPVAESGGGYTVTEHRNPEVSGQPDETALSAFVQQRLCESLTALRAFSERNEDCAPWVTQLTRNLQSDLELVEDIIPNEGFSVNGAEAPINIPVVAA